MRHTKYAALAFVAATLFMVGCSGSVAQQEGEMAPDFTLPAIKGGSVTLSQYQGKVVILDFFADWCPPCRQEVPDFIALQDAYGPKGFAVIGVALVSKEDASKYAQSAGINYPVLIDDGKVSGVYGPVRSIPTTFVIDKSGKIIKKYIGSRSKDVFEADIQELLK
jgi:cytochrome c biogenesis protein CcmG/thiol:disulfide interchange protein DsbE